MSFDGHEGPATIINYQPSEAWEEEFDAAFVQEGVSGNYIQLTMNSAPEVKSFIRTLIAEAREEGRIGGHRRYNEGYQHGAEDGRMEVHSKDGAAWDAGLAQGRGAKENITTMRLKAFDEGRKEALKECLEVVEGMKKEMDFVLPHDSVTVIGILSHNEAVEAIKQQITSLLEKHE